MPERRRRPTLKDIAEETGLSSAAVSYALRGLQVPVQTQERVREAADRLGYTGDPIARALASGRTGNVGLLCGSLEDIWQQSLAAALGRGLLGVGRQALIVDATNNPDQERKLAMQLVDQRVDALIAMPVDPKAAHWAAVAERVVLVSIGDGLPGAAAAAEVVFDNEAAVADALRELANAGHRRITVLTSVAASTPDRPAEAVVHRVGPALGITAGLLTAPYDLAGATSAALRMLTGPDRPTGVLCLSDSLAYGVYAAARELGLRIPDDLSIMGFDDHPLSALLTPPLSSYRWPVEELVATVVRLTLDAIEATDSGSRSRRRVLVAQPRRRGSVGAVRSVGALG
ncbi:LacI family transcriptional regulator [Nakamurella sp. UYEF19]|uniref:LacI family DNA-binding transcriptional regulator n=1 Tax=Nakamurella sp. UYEF19 TaxID=1756392 RepID=UPI0033943C4D